MTVSAAFLVKDPPIDRLVLLLEYLRPVVSDTVIVVDDRTAAETVAIMADWPRVTLVPFTWINDFAVARNAAIKHCQGDWVLHLDPDEMPSAAMLEFIRTVDSVQQKDVIWRGATYRAPRGYLFFTKNFFDGRQGEEWEEHWHCRLFKRDSGWWYKPVHEQVSLDGQSEDRTRNTVLMPKAPLAAYIIHSRMEDRRKDEQYAAIAAEITA